VPKGDLETKAVLVGAVDQQQLARWLLHGWLIQAQMMANAHALQARLGAAYTLGRRAGKWDQGAIGPDRLKAGLRTRTGTEIDESLGLRWEQRPPEGGTPNWDCEGRSTKVYD